MKALFLIFGLFSLGVATAGGFSVAAVPTRVDVVGGEGFMMTGAFGNAGGCTQGNLLFVKAGHPQYKQLYAAALAALTMGAKITVYAHACESIGWYSVPSVTYNIVTADGSFAIGN